MRIWFIDKIREGSCWVLEQSLFVVFALRASMYYPPTFQCLPSCTANFLELQSMLFPTFILKSCFFSCCRGIQAFPQAQKYGWLTNQTVYFKNFLFLFFGLLFKLTLVNWGSYGCLFHRFSNIITYILAYRKFLVFWE